MGLTKEVIMKHFVALLFALGTLFVAVSAAASSSTRGKASHPDHVIPLLVHVDETGKVTDVSAAYKLRPAMQNRLRDALRKMITQPAMQDGKPVSSQFVVNLSLVPVPREDGKYDMTVKYVSSKPLPAGQWYWTRVTESHRFALTNEQAARFEPHTDFMGGNPGPSQQYIQQIQRQSSSGGASSTAK